MNPPPPKVLALPDTAYDQGKGWRKGQHLIDALPYIDEPSPEVRRQVDALINEEMNRSVKRPQDYLKDLPAPGAPNIASCRSTLVQTTPHLGQDGAGLNRVDFGASFQQHLCM